MDGSNGAPLIIDEAQRSRKLPLALKRLMLTGSSNMFATRHVVDSLAGRVRTLTRWPKRCRAARPRSSIGRPRIRRTRRLCRRPSRRRGPAIRLRPQGRLSRCPGSRAWKATEDPSRLPGHGGRPGRRGHRPDTEDGRAAAPDPPTRRPHGDGAQRVRTLRDRRCAAADGRTISGCADPVVPGRPAWRVDQRGIPTRDQEREAPSQSCDETTNDGLTP